MQCTCTCTCCNIDIVIDCWGLFPWHRESMESVLYFMRGYTLHCTITVYNIRNHLVLSLQIVGTVWEKKTWSVWDKKLVESPTDDYNIPVDKTSLNHTWTQKSLVYFPFATCTIYLVDCARTNCTEAPSHHWTISISPALTNMVYKNTLTIYLGIKGFSTCISLQIYKNIMLNFECDVEKGIPIDKLQKPCINFNGILHKSTYISI